MKEKTNLAIEPNEKRIHTFRCYKDVYSLLRRIFDIPNDEMIINLTWDDNRGELVLETINNK